jgi:putative ABC transport system permease protein
MIKKVFHSFLLALHNIRSHFFHTLLSVLGIVIGVAALVSVLSLIDGMEQYAHDQISQTTSLKVIAIQSNPNKTINNVRIRKDSFKTLSYADLEKIQLDYPAKLYLRSSYNYAITVKDSTIGTQVHAINPQLLPSTKVLSGVAFTREDLDSARFVAIVNESFAKKTGLSHESIVGKSIVVGERTFIINGVFAEERASGPQLLIPFTVLSQSEVMASPPELLIEADNVENVPALREQVDSYLRKVYPNNVDDFRVFTNDLRVSQAKKAFQLFRVIMGLIVGISVVVGGIGVMNVLLISVTERTAEIGIRKAVGANRSDITLQFLSESIAISAFGSFLGLVVGIVFTMIAIPVIKALTDVPFHAAYTLNTLATIAIVALLVGVVFGTYPAIRASRLDPVEAIRRE